MPSEEGRSQWAEALLTLLPFKWSLFTLARVSSGSTLTVSPTLTVPLYSTQNSAFEPSVSTASCTIALTPASPLLMPFITNTLAVKVPFLWGLVELP